MFDFLGSRIQKTMANINKKTILTEADILEITREIKMSLLEADVNLTVVKDFTNSVKEKVVGQELINKLNPSQQMVKIIKEELIKILGTKAHEIKIEKSPYILMLVGLQGGGKTTTVAKLATYLKRKNNIKKVLLIAADVYRPAAINQLAKLAKEINVDLFEKGIEVDPRIIVEEGISKARSEHYDLVIIDTAGRLSINEELMTELVDIKKIAKPNKSVFVLDAMSGQDIINVAQIFNNKLQLDGSILTKLDSDSRGGAALSVTYLLKIPILFIGTGERINNLDLFHPERMAERILGMGDVLSLIEKAESVIDKDESKKMFRKMMKGEFDLDDLLNNLKQVRKMGKISKLIKMLPNSIKVDENKLGGAEDKIKLYEILINSMTKEERKNPKLLKNASRKNRIIKGSGRDIKEYNKLLNDFENMKKRIKEMSKVGGKTGGFDPSAFGM
ncbi:MAG: signal recognition particle protein [Metamycoplasmataceae bacterium]